MPQCQFCAQPATVHLTDVADRRTRTWHLCDACASERQLVAPEPGGAVNAQAIVELLRGPAQGGAPGHGALTCPACGLQYEQFCRAGRLGCPADYEAFRPALAELLGRVQPGGRHVGKRPRS